MPYYWSQIETLENLQYVAGLVDGFNQDRFLAALMGKRSVGKDKIVHMRNELVEITNKLEEEYLVLDEFGKTFNDKFATRNNACFSSAMTLLRKMRSGMSKMIDEAMHGDNKRLRDYMNSCVLAARQGAVMVSPFISDKEKEVMIVLLAEEHPIIYIADNGFRDCHPPRMRSDEQDGRGDL